MKNSAHVFRVGALPMVLLGLLGASLIVPTSTAVAQEGPPPPREGRDGPPGMRPPRDRDEGPEGRDGPRHDGPPGGLDGERDGPPSRGPGGPARGPDYDQMRGYMELVERYAKMARDPSSSGVAAVVASSDTLRRQGPKAAAEFFEKLLPDVKNETVARAIRIQLADLYRKAGMEEKALEQLKVLIISVPAGELPKPTE